MSFRRKAFTLVELLVVVAIIAIIVAMLIPALSKAREQARRVQCGSGLHQLAIGMVTYASESRGNLPKTNLNGTMWWGSRTNLFQNMLYDIPPFPPTITKVWGRAIWYCPTGPKNRPHMYGPDVESFNWWYNDWDGLGYGNYGIATDYNLWWGRAVDDAKFAIYDGQFNLSAREFAAYRVEQSGKVLASDMVLLDPGVEYQNWSNHLSKRGSGVALPDGRVPGAVPDGGNFVYMDCSNRWWNIERILEDHYEWTWWDTPDLRYAIPQR